MIKRKLLSELTGHLSAKEITMIVGARQSGKTSLMRMLEEKLKTAGERTLFLNLDIEEERKFFESQDKLLSKIKLEIGIGGGFVFIDEMQRKENAGIFLKGIYDLQTPYKFIVSGSGSMELKEKIHESLIGRKRLFELTTVTFEEFVDFRTAYRYEGRLQEFFEIERDQTIALLIEYLNFGGYPRVVTEDTLKEKRLIIDEIFRSYVERDIALFLKVEKFENYSNMIRLIASQVGNLINYSEICNSIGLSMPTLKNYLYYAEKTFIIQKITPYFNNARKELSKSPVYYFSDIGLRNYGIGFFGMLSEPDRLSFPFENMIYNILKEKVAHTGGEIHFWRTKDGAEVDFIIDFKRMQIPVEVKYKSLKEPKPSRSFLSFIKQYNPKNAYLINLSLESEIKIGETTVKFLPFYKLFFGSIETDGNR